MTTNILMPSLGFDMTSGAIARWLKQEGDPVRQGEPIAEVETDKATVEIQAFVTGSLQKIAVPPGQSVPVGTVIGVIAAPGESLVPATAAAAPTPSPRAAPAEPAPHPTAEAEPLPAAGDGWTKASPVARRMAQVEGVNLKELAGTGPGGRIIQKDVEEYVARRKASPAPIALPVAPPGPAAPVAAAAGAQEMALSRMRQAIARRMGESKQTIPHFYVTFDVNMTEAMRLREQLNALAPEKDKLSINDLILAAAARTLARWPVLNASYRGDKLELHPTVNLGIAVALETGLITPVLHDADRKPLNVLASEAHALVERTRANKMHPEDLNGGTFTLSNLGMYGVEEFSGIINPPEAAILAVGAIAKRPIVVGEEVRVAQMMKATISVDHRVADGAQAARFMRDLQLLLENPVNLLIGP